MTEIDKRDTIFTRGELYLSERYTWIRIPYLSPWWHVPVVLKTLSGMKKKADGMAKVSGKVIDLDTLDVIKL